MTRILFLSLVIGSTAFGINTNFVADASYRIFQTINSCANDDIKANAAAIYPVCGPWIRSGMPEPVPDLGNGFNCGVVLLSTKGVLDAMALGVPLNQAVMTELYNECTNFFGTGYAKCDSDMVNFRTRCP